MLLLGVLQAQAAGAGPVGGPAFDLLDEEILLSAASSVTFSGLDTLAAGYQHLQIRYSAQGDRGSPHFQDLMSVYFNGDTGANYSFHYLRGYENAVQSGYSNLYNFNYVSLNYKNANLFAAGVIDILDPFETTKYKTMRSLNGYMNNSSSFENAVALASGSWRNTNAVNSITLDPALGANFTARSRFSLYGIKAGS